MSRKEEILMHSALIYDHVETKMKEHMEFAKDIQKGCTRLGYSKFIPAEYIDGYDSALTNMIRILSDIKIGG